MAARRCSTSAATSVAIDGDSLPSDSSVSTPCAIASRTARAGSGPGAALRARTRCSTSARVTASRALASESGRAASVQAIPAPIYATRPSFVLMDEPAAGLPEAEVPDFAAVVRSVRDDHGAGVLLIDHNMALIMDVCDRIQVLDQGRTLAAGTPAEIRANLDVAAAYLGESAVHEGPS